MKTHALRKYQDGVGSLAGRCFRCFRHDVTAQEARSTSKATHDREPGSEGTSFSLRCSISRATGVFSLVSATPHGYRAHAAKDCLGQAESLFLQRGLCCRRTSTMEIRRVQQRRRD